MLQKMSKIVCRGFQRVIKEGQRLKIIELGNDNAATELLIDTGNAESLGLIQHQDRGPESKRTRAAVCMEGKRVVTRMRNRAAYTWHLNREGEKTWAHWSCGVEIVGCK